VRNPAQIVLSTMVTGILIAFKIQSGVKIGIFPQPIDTLNFIASTFWNRTGDRSGHVSTGFCHAASSALSLIVFGVVHGPRLTESWLIRKCQGR
jgi:hypothetical protein